MKNNPYGAQAYQNVGLETGVVASTPHGLVLMLFDGSIRSVLLARQAMESGATAQKGQHISKAIEIISLGLSASLDKNVGGDIAQSLAALYEYMCRRLVHANLNNDQAVLDEIHALLRDLRGAWAGIEGSAGPVTAARPELRSIAA